MKKRIFFLMLVVSATLTSCTKEPTVVLFEDYLLANYDLNHDGYISTEEASLVRLIHCRGLSMTSMQGLDRFVNLEGLWCDDNQLKILDVSKNVLLKKLVCDDNQLTHLDVSNNVNLIKFNCSDNELTSLDVSKNSEIEYLSCYGNNLKTIDISNNLELEILLCARNQLTTIDLSKNRKLNHLWCIDNQLTSLDFSNNPDILWLWCNGNKLTTLNLSNTRLGLNDLTIQDLERSAILKCAMKTLTTLILKPGSKIDGITKNRDEICILPHTNIEYGY